MLFNQHFYNVCQAVKMKPPFNKAIFLITV